MKSNIEVKLDYVGTICKMIGMAVLWLFCATIIALVMTS